MEIYTVAFFGHRYIDNFSRAENGVESIVRDLLNSHEYVDFLIGRDGDFDQIVSSTVKRMKRAIRDDNSSLTWALPYPTAELEKIADSDERINRGHAAEMVLFGHDIETTLASQDKVDGYFNGEKLQLKASLISWKGTKNNGMGSATFVAA